MSAITIILFFIYAWGLGYTITKFVRNSEIFLERNIMRIGIGLGLIPFLGVLLSLCRIPLDWKLFFILSLILPLYDLFKLVKNKNYPKLNFKLKKSNIYIIIVLILFFLTLFMYTKGAFSYPWLEDDDPWFHATGMKYISIEKNIFPENDVFMYINPYPPGYDILFGILHQTSPSLNWTMKFFNALIISLGVFFFYFFVKRFIGNEKKALFATFILASIPSYLSHFIWAHSLVVTLFFPAMYCIEMLKEDKKWMYPSILIIASICLVQPTQPIKFAFLFGFYFIIKWISAKKFNFSLLAALFGGYILSAIWWFNHFKPMFLSTSAKQIVESGANYTIFQKVIGIFQKVFPPSSGSATRAYSFNDIVFAKHQNMINNPIGIGIFISLLIVLGLFFVIIKYRKLLDDKNNYLLITSLWAIFTFLGFNAMTFNLPVGLFSFRFWMLFAIPASILAAEGLWFLYILSKRIRIPPLVILVIVIIGVIFTSASQKYSVNTAIWPPGVGWSSYEEVQSYNWLKQNLPVDTGVFTFAENFYVIGFDMFSCEWCFGVKEYQTTAINRTASELNSWLKKEKYSYLVVDGKTLKKFGLDDANNKIKELIDSNLFKPVHQSEGMIILGVV